jgi:hypothetical protein
MIKPPPSNPAQTSAPVVNPRENPQSAIERRLQSPSNRKTVQTILPNMLTSAPCMSLIDLPPPCNGIERTAMIPDNGGTWK